MMANSEQSSGHGRGFMQFNRRTLIADRYRCDLTQRIDDLAGAPGDHDQLTGELGIRALGRNIHGERGEPLRCAIQRTRDSHTDVGHCGVAGANRRKKVAGEAAAQRDQHVLAPCWSQIQAALRDPSVDKQGNVWFVGQTGHYVGRLNPNNGEFKKYC